MALFELPILDLENENCKIGDIYKLYFDVKYKIGGIEKALLTYIVERTDKFEVEHSEYDPGTGQLVLICRVIKNPLPFLVVFGIIMAGATSFLYMLGVTLSKVHKVIEAPVGKVLALVIAGVTVVLITKYVILKK